MDKKHGRFLNFQNVIVVLESCIDFAFVLKAHSNGITRDEIKDNN